MGPETLALLIPIMALSIPIIAIITRARTARYKADPNQLEYVKRLESRIFELETTVSQINGDVEKLEDKQNFISRLLEDKT